MKLINNIKCGVAFLLSAGVMMMSSCQKETDTVAKAVLASAASLSFEATSAPAQVITVYSDAEWYAEVPEWVTIDPQTGSGTVDVTVTVTENMREGAMDNPRKADLIFRGKTLDSRAFVKIFQAGDKYRGVENFTVSQAVAAADESVIVIPEAQVVAYTTKGVVISDGKANMYVSAINDDVKIGVKVSVKGTKGLIEKLPAITLCDELKVTAPAETVTYPEAKDISSDLDAYKSSTMEYVTVEGVLQGSALAVGDATYKVSVKDPLESYKLADLGGHVVRITGYFAGLAEPFINIIASNVEDKGIFEVVYFQDDFSWLKKYVDACEANGEPVSSCVEDKITNGDGARNIYTFATLTGLGLLEDLRGRGYVDVNPEMKTIYLQKFYFKFGATSKQSGLTLPPMAADIFADGAKDIFVSFDWCAHVGGSGKPDSATEMIVVIEGPGMIESASDETGKISTTFTSTQQINPESPDFFWMNAKVKVTGVTEETRITIRPAFIGGKLDGKKTYMRYYMDNIKVVPAE